MADYSCQDVRCTRQEERFRLRLQLATIANIPSQSNYLRIVEYNIPFLSFVFSYVVNVSHLRRVHINLPYVIYATGGNIG